MGKIGRYGIEGFPLSGNCGKSAFKQGHETMRSTFTVAATLLALWAFGIHLMADEPSAPNKPQKVSHEKGVDGLSCGHTPQTPTISPTIPQRCHTGSCVGGSCAEGTCHSCNGNCCEVCPMHGRDCRFGCLKNATSTFFRQFPLRYHYSEQPFFGLRPIIQPPAYGPSEEPCFPRVHNAIWGPPAPMKFIKTAPEPQMPFYTTRSPRDIYCPNPPNIGY